MPRPYSHDVRDRVVWAAVSGSSARAAARPLGVSESVAIKSVQRWRRTGSATAKQMGERYAAVSDAHMAATVAKLR